MQTHTQNWKNKISDLKDHARAVAVSEADSVLSARAAARALSGAVTLVASRYGVDAMQRACADLVRSGKAWSTSFGSLPLGHDGRVPEALALVAALSRGLLPLAGADNLRAALAFWSIEGDAAAWAGVAG